MTTTERYRQALEKIRKRISGSAWHIDTGIVELIDEALASATPNENGDEEIKKWVDDRSFCLNDDLPDVMVIPSDQVFEELKKAYSLSASASKDYGVDPMGHAYKIPSSKDEETGIRWMKWSEQERLVCVLGWIEKQVEWTHYNRTSEASIFYHIAPIIYAKLIVRFLRDEKIIPDYKSGKDEPQKDLEWVKASERLSGHYEKVCCQKIGYKGFYFTANYDWSIKTYRGTDGRDYQIDEIIWLDESGQQTNSESNEAITNSLIK